MIYIAASYAAKWGVQIAGMNFPTRSETDRGRSVVFFLSVQ
ncbi:DUF6783 domain-containing protein [uncultured Robinsoniella sp.]